MGNFTFHPTALEGVFVIDTKTFADSRGYFMETYEALEFKAAGLSYEFVQDNWSTSSKGVLRGLHYQKRFPQAKLVRVIHGEVFDVAVDLRCGSKTYGKWIGEILSEENRRQLMIPRGFAHGFLVLSDKAELAYKCDEFYHPEDEGGILWSDPQIGIQWPICENVILSEKDKRLPMLAQSGVVFGTRD